MKCSMLCLFALLAAACFASAGEPFPQVGAISPATMEVLEELDQKAPMRDGAQLMIDVFRPKAEGRFPAIVYHTPYDKSGGRPAPSVRRPGLRGGHGRFARSLRFGRRVGSVLSAAQADGFDLVEWIAQQSVVQRQRGHVRPVVHGLATMVDGITVATVTQGHRARGGSARSFL